MSFFFELGCYFCSICTKGCIRVAEKCQSEERDNGEEEYIVNPLEVVERK
jgi:aerobic-type carbon monoxide dehydrogenase small subunit (CoxS/CutS family)